jgi:hypothetical protein
VSFEGDQCLACSHFPQRNAVVVAVRCRQGLAIRTERCSALPGGKRRAPPKSLPTWRVPLFLPVATSHRVISSGRPAEIKVLPSGVEAIARTPSGLNPFHVTRVGVAASLVTSRAILSPCVAPGTGPSLSLRAGAGKDTRLGAAGSP